MSQDLLCTAMPRKCRSISDWAGLEITAWSLLSHVLVAIIVISALNLIRLATRHVSRPTSLRLVLNGIAIALVIGTVLDHFLASALSFEGWAAHLYASLFAVTLTLFLATWSRRSWRSTTRQPDGPNLALRSMLLPFAVVLSALAIVMPTIDRRR